MYRAHLSTGASLQAQSNSAYNFGTADFTVMAMIVSQQGGTVVARKGTAGGSGNGGFLLVVNPNGSVKFATDNGYGYYQVVSGSSGVLDGNCHTIAGIRSGANLSILIDGVAVPVTASGNAKPPLNVNNSLPLTIGRTQQSQEPHNQFVGDIMNVSVWNAALSGDQLVQAGFARITGSESNLQGYWTLNNTTSDLSPRNNPANIVGTVTFEYCLSCVWTEAANDYVFCQIANISSSNTPDINVTTSHAIVVPVGASVFGMAIMTDQDAPAFPVGAQVTLSDPSGFVYRQDQNTDTLFAATSGGQLWSLMAINPAAGAWKVTVTAPATTSFQLTMQTVPTSEVVQTSRQALDPLYSGTSNQTLTTQRTLQALSLDSWWDVVTAVAVGVVVGAVVAGAVVFTGGAALPAVAAGFAAFSATEYGIIASSLPSYDSSSLTVATGQVGGTAGFIVAVGKLLLFDANSDPATELTYKQRKKKLYPQVVASSFNKVQSQLVGSDDTLSKIQAALTGFTTGYVSGSGHGQAFYLMGWYANGTDGPLQEVLATSRSAQFTPAMVTGKIFHFLACNCGYTSETSQGLGQAMVTAGAIAFFGYDKPYIISVSESPAFCACDIAIDKAMIYGATCDEAYQQSIELFKSTIKTLRIEGNTQAAANLENNMNALVSPSTNAMYGNQTARLKIS